MRDIDIRRAAKANICGARVIVHGYSELYTGNIMYGRGRQEDENFAKNYTHDFRSTGIQLYVAI